MGRISYGIDSMIDRKFNQLTVVERVENSASGHVRFLCKCDCGNETIVYKVKLESGHTKTCGKCSKDGIVIYSFDGDCGFGVFSISGVTFSFDTEDFWKIKDLGLAVKHDKNTKYILSTDQNPHIYIHRLIMDARPNEFVDHKNGDGLNNRKFNLRKCTKQQNAFNHKIFSTNTSGVAGVTFDNSRNKWAAQITIDRKNIHLGRFYEFDEAVCERLKAEKQFFGDFAPQKHLFAQYGIE